MNVPLNTPAFIFLIARSTNDLEPACQVLESYNIPFNMEYRRTKTIINSSQLIPTSTIFEIKNRYPQYEPKRVAYYRYVFFELDSLDDNTVLTVLKVYASYNLPVYYHRTMRGWHFFSVKPVTDELYVEIMNILKPLNTACPHVTLRIRPNKWIGEKQIWNVSKVIMPAIHSDTAKFARMIDQQTYWRYAQPFGKGKWIVDKKYLVVNYKQTGERGAL